MSGTWYRHPRRGRSFVGSLVLAVVATVLVVTSPPVAAAGPNDSFGLVDPTTGLWHLYDKGVETAPFYFGNPGDHPFMGDWDCDGVDTPGLYRRSDGYVYLRNSNTQGIADISFYFGNPGDVPIAGDFNADGCDTVSIYRPNEARFYVINKLGTSDKGLGAADYSFLFGNLGDKPFAGDFNGNGQDTVGLHRESTGLVYFRNTNTTGIADSQFIFGNPADRLIAADWNKDGKDAPGVFRPSNTTLYLRHTNTQGNADESYTLGGSSWIPVSGTFGELVKVNPKPTALLTFKKDGHLHTMFSDDTVKPLTGGSNEQNLPRWSPGGQKILYGNTDPSYPANDGMWVMNFDGTDQERVWDATEGDWSPDGKFIVFVSRNISVGDPDAACPGDDIFLLECHDNLYILDLYLGSIRQLTFDADNYEVAWSPDGTRIAFTSNRDGDWDIYTINPDGTDLTNVTDNAVEDHSASWVPDSSGLVHSTKTGGQYDLWLSAFGHAPVQLTNNVKNDLHPAVSSDGTVAFAQQQGATVNSSIIFITTLSGEAPTSTGQRGHMPDWRK